jgi:diguanylate cyclase (GGDEF)-like protein/putative nucleotidyltransferase with HDIG domain
VLSRKQRESEADRELVAARSRIAELERELEVRSVRDRVTGLATLEAFVRRLDSEVERSRRHARALTVAVLDLDGFRSLNARHGREVADELLVAVGKVLTRCTRASDLSSRTSGDEFTVMLPEMSGDEAMQCMERILLELEALQVGPLNGVSASIGLSEYRKPMGASDLIAEADVQLDRARAAGGGRAERAGTTAATEDEAGGSHKDAIAGLTEALLERDRYTGEHSESVVQLVESVARGLGLDDEEVWRVKAAALLHDIGKVAIPDHILNKPGKLDDEEWKLMREHPAIGERILRAIPGLGGVARIVRHEHERFDGKGYPDGISGEEVPIGSRIILACDAYHAMTSDRPYRQAMPHAEAVRELAKSAGTQFDPQVTEVLIGCLYGNRQLSHTA